MSKGFCTFAGSLHFFSLNNLSNSTYSYEHLHQCQHSKGVRNSPHVCSCAAGVAAGCQLSLLLHYAPCCNPAILHATNVPASPPNLLERAALQRLRQNRPDFVYCVQDDLWAVIEAQLQKRCDADCRQALAAMPQQAAARALLQPGGVCLDALAATLQQCGQPAARAELEGCSLADLRMRVAKVGAWPSGFSFGQGEGRRGGLIMRVNRM